MNATTAAGLLKRFIDLCAIGDVDESTEVHGWGQLIRDAKEGLRSLPGGGDPTGISPWFPMDKLNDVRVAGKLLEELGECTSATARCLIQGLDGLEPVTGKPNRTWLEEEIADARATMQHAIMQFDLDENRIRLRERDKSRKLQRWLDIIEKPAS